MNILITTRSLPEHIMGGMEYYAKDTAIELAKLGHSITVLTTFLKNENIKHYTNNDIDIVDIKSTPSGRYSQSWWKKSKAYYQLNKGKFDLVLSISTSARSIAEITDRCPVVVQCHGTVIGEIHAKWRSRSFWSYAKSIKNIYQLAYTKHDYKVFDYIIAVGDQVAQDLFKWPLRLPAEKVELIRNGVPSNPYTNHKPRNNPKRVLSLCRLHQQKGVQHSIAAFKSEKLKEIELDIAGSGPYENTLLRKAHGAKNINFIGKIDRQEVPQLLVKYDAFIFTSTRVEGYPLNLVEALAAQLPIIASEHLTKNLPVKTGVFPVDPRNRDSVISGTINALLSAPPKLSSEYKIENVMKKYTEAFEKVCKDQ